MFQHIFSWMNKSESKKNQVLWNSAKVSSIKTDFLYKKNYVKKYVLVLIGIITGLVFLVKKRTKIIKHCKAI